MRRQLVDTRNCVTGSLQCQGAKLGWQVGEAEGKEGRQMLHDEDFSLVRLHDTPSAAGVTWRRHHLLQARRGSRSVFLSRRQSDE